MSDKTKTPGATDPREAGAMLFAAGGLAAAFGAASCCALPVLLGSIGLGSVWLGGIALFAGPYQSVLLAAAVACLLPGGVLLWRRRAIACAPGAACERHGVRMLTTLILTVGAVLAVLGYAIA